MTCCGNRIFLVVAGCLAVGVAAGCLVRIALGSSDAESVSESVPDNPVAVSPVSPGKAAPAAVDEDAECRRLQEKVARLERELDVIGDGNDRARNESGFVPYGEVRANCKTYGEWKRRYPKEYESAHKMISHIAIFRIKNYEKWRQFMSSIDVSGLPEDDRRAHGELMETYAQVFRLMKEDLEEDDERTFEQAEAIGKEIGRLQDKARELMANERNILMGAVAENLGRRLGWQGEDIAAFAETLKAIAEVTAENPQR